MGALETLAIATNQFETKVCRRQGIEGDIVAGGPGVQTTIFTITGGGVQIKMLFGHVTTVIAGAATLLINFTPTAVYGATLVPLCAVSGSIDTDAVHTILHWDGTVADGLGPATALGYCGTAEIAWAADCIVVTPGIITIGNAGALATGVIDWYCAYVPCTMGAIVIPA